MSTLQEKQLLFNTQINISNDGGQLSSDAGISIIQEFLNCINFDELVREMVHFCDSRKYSKHSAESLLKQLLFQIICGYSSDSSATFLRHDPMFKLVFTKSELGSQSTLSRFLNGSCNAETIYDLKQLIQKLVDIDLKRKNQQEMIIDVDSTHSDTYGNQEDTNYNAHYNTNGYHPLVAFESLSGHILGSELRPGNVYTSTGIVEFLAPILEHYRSFPCDMKILVRGDSGFARPDFYQLCEDNDSNFVVRLKANRRLINMAEKFISIGDDTDFTQKSVCFNELNYHVDTWNNQYRVISKTTREANEFIFKHEFIVTNLEHTNADEAFKTYQNRGVVENLIKELKNGFFFDKTDSSSFVTNAVRSEISSIAYTIVQLIKRLVLPVSDNTDNIEKIRFKLIRVAVKITFHARKIRLQLSSSNVFDRLFWQTLHKIQTFIL